MQLHACSDIQNPIECHHGLANEESYVHCHVAIEAVTFKFCALFGASCRDNHVFCLTYLHNFLKFFSVILHQLFNDMHETQEYIEWANPKMKGSPKRFLR